MYYKLILPFIACGMLASAAELTASSLEIVNPGPFPMMKRATVNPVFAVKLEASNTGTPGSVTFTVFPANSVDEVILRTGEEKGIDFKDSVVVGKAKPNGQGQVTIKCNEDVGAGETWLWVDATPSAKSTVGGVVEFRNIEAKVGSKEAKSDPIQQRVGYMVALPGEEVAPLSVSKASAKQAERKKKAKNKKRKKKGADEDTDTADTADNLNGEGASETPRKCTAFRIPGLTTTHKGTLVGCFDARYGHEGDLCADIDVAVVRSTDGGQTWTTPEVAMDAGPGGNNGCGDPCILQDNEGRIWLQSLAAHFGGGAVLGVSKAGQGADVTGQWIMTYSEDEGKTWTKEFINPTTEVKKDEWTCILAGPGRGIVTRRGVIVFPAQIWWNNPPKGTHRCRSTICYSKDGGETWAFGEGIPHSTSECQVVELKDGSIMINARNEARSGKRVVYVTKDLGKTWEPHETNLNTLEESTCQASILSAKMKKYNRILLFSNPKTTWGRHTMTIRVSRDDGKTWSDGYEYDRRPCLGYSCLTQIDDENIGVFYEVAHKLTGARGIGFLRFPIKTIVTEKTEPAGTKVTTGKRKPGSPSAADDADETGEDDAADEAAEDGSDDIFEDAKPAKKRKAA